MKYFAILLILLIPTFGHAEFVPGDHLTKQDVQLFLKQDHATRLATGVCSGTLLDFNLQGKRVGGLFSGCSFASASVTGDDPNFSGAIGVGADFMGIKLFGGRDPVRGKWSGGIGFSLVGGLVDTLTK